MDSSRWKKILEAFDRARRPAPASMDSLLAALWGGEEESPEEIKEQLVSEEQPGAPIMEGDSLGGYRIGRKLGEGGFGQVFAAVPKSGGAPVAIKVIRETRLFDDGNRRRFLREARLTGQLRHPNVVRVLDVIEEERLAAIVMELVDGQPLTAQIPRDGMPFEEISRTAAEICGALAEAHSRGIVHRDLKPANVMIDTTGTARVLDFGAAKELLRNAADTGGSTASGMVIGTPVYMSPEQVRGERVTVQSDIFSFGSLLYEMVTGRAPFKRKSPLATMSAILREEPVPIGAARAEVPDYLVRLVERCLVKDSAGRLGAIGVAEQELVRCRK